MIKKMSRKKIIFTAVIAALIVFLISGGLYLVAKNKNNQTEAKIVSNNTNPNQESTPVQASNPASNSSIDSATSTQPNTNVQPPQIPSLTMSAGNYRSTRSGEMIDFTCNATVNITCQIILTSGSKQIALPEQVVKDNGRGQVFTIWDWTSISGKWSVIARAKNSQGATSSSPAQILEVK